MAKDVTQHSLHGYWQSMLQEETRHPIAALTAERAYVLPHPALREIISHYTVYIPKRNGSPKNITVIPDASVAIALCIKHTGMEARLWGPASRATEVENDPHKIPLYVMVEFFPGGASRIFHFPLSLLHNEISRLENVDRALSAFLAEQVETHLAVGSPQGLDAFFSALDQLFLRRLEHAKAARLPKNIVLDLQRTHGVLRVGDLARQSGCSERQLNRLMSEGFGMGAKLLARIIRVNAACLALRSPSLSLTGLAHALHYHDQSHFIHDFSAVCGLAPGDYLQRMSVFYNEELKFGDSFPEK